MLSVGARGHNARRPLSLSRNRKDMACTGGRAPRLGVPILTLALTPPAPYASYYLRPFDAAAASLGVVAVAAQVNSESDLESVFAEQSQVPETGLVVMPDGFLNVYRSEIVLLAARYGLPVVYPWRFFAEIVGLMSYGFDQRDSYRTAAAYIDRRLGKLAPMEKAIV